MRDNSVANSFASIAGKGIGQSAAEKSFPYTARPAKDGGAVKRAPFALLAFVVNSIGHTIANLRVGRARTECGLNGVHRSANAVRAKVVGGGSV
jgi:hypothetical protein